MSPILEHEPITLDQWRRIVTHLGPMKGIILHLDEVDFSAGAGKLARGEKCLWIKDGRRITISTMPGGGYLTGISLDPDPAYQSGRFPLEGS